MINNTREWIDNLVEGKKINPNKAYDLKLRLQRAETEELIDQEYTVNSVRHEIRNVLENGGVGFAVLVSTQARGKNKVEPLKPKNGQR